jgi:glycine betaine/choline ABC-type transport system substrate-binding protein
MEKINYKKEIIGMVNELGEDKKFWNRMNESKSFKNKEGKLGSSNIRSVANICQNADCYEEIKLYIEYKIGKGNGWDDTLTNNKKFGQAIIEDMDKIYEMVNKDDKKTLKIVSLYFGYLYWKKTAIEKGNF